MTFDKILKYRHRKIFCISFSLNYRMSTKQKLGDSHKCLVPSFLNKVREVVFLTFVYEYARIFLLYK